MSHSSSTCQNCSNNYDGSFCNQCGERRFDTTQRKISVLFANLIESLFEVDGKFFKTVRYFITKPGFLAYEHWRGVRKPYMTPIAFFVIINIIYFLFSPLTDFALPLSNQEIQPYSAWVQPTIDAYLSLHSITLEQLAVKYDAISGAVAKSLVILSVPFLVPFIWAINPSRKYYLLDHCVSAVQIYCFVLVWPIIVSVLLTVFYWITNWTFIGDILLFLLLSAFYLYAAFFQYFMYRNAWWVCLIKGAVITVGIGVSHFIYRFLQFWIVWWQVT